MIKLTKYYQAGLLLLITGCATYNTDTNFIRTLDKVNTSVNNEMEYELRYGCQFNPNPKKGNCCDSVTVKETKLFIAGIHPRRMERVFCITSEGVAHVVLKVDGWYLDNRINRLKTTLSNCNELK